MLEAQTVPAPDGYPFALHRGLSDRPPVSVVANSLIRRYSHVSEKHLVEVGDAIDLAKRADLDPWALHVNKEVRKSLMFRDAGITAGKKDPPVTVLRHRCPHLLAVENPSVSIPFGSGDQAS